MHYTYDKLEAEIKGRAARIKAPESLLPTYRVSEDGALPHIVIDDNGLYHFIVVERGEELDHKRTADAEELLYWVFDGITFSMACNYELQHRVSYQDFRVLLFKHQQDLLGILSPHWKQQKIREHEQVLERYPFDNNCH